MQTKIVAGALISLVFGIGTWAVNNTQANSNSIGEIRTNVAGVQTEVSGIDRRLERIEDKLDRVLGQ